MRRGVRVNLRKSAPQVTYGKAQRKNRTALTPSYWNTPQNVPAIDRQRPGSGYRHILKRKDIETFIRIVPDWDAISEGLNAIVLAPGKVDTDGWHSPGIVAICAWERELWQYVQHWYFEEHRDIIERLSIETTDRAETEELEECVEIRWTENGIRAYQLVHVLMHELGHHHDRMTTRSKRRSSRGESHAEGYAREFEPVIWQRFFEVFSYD